MEERVYENVPYVENFYSKEYEKNIRRNERLQMKKRLKARLEILIQKFIGIVILGVSIIMAIKGLFYEPAVENNDITMLVVVMLPLSLALIFSNKKIIDI